MPIDPPARIVEDVSYETNRDRQSLIRRDFQKLRRAMAADTA